MIPSGPFAMGPSMAGSSSFKKRAPRSNFAPIIPSGPSSIGGGLSNTTAPTLTREREIERAKVKQEDEEVEAYSDPDEGVQIIDIDAVKTMDWMAPESLRREKDQVKKSKQKKIEAMKKDVKGKSKEGICLKHISFQGGRYSDTLISVDAAATEAVQVQVQKNLANALDLSESEEEEEMEDLIEDFAHEMEDEVCISSPEIYHYNLIFRTPISAKKNYISSNFRIRFPLSPLQREAIPWTSTL